MNREEMLNKLHSIKPGVRLTVLPDEYALECDYVTRFGNYYEWIGMNDWPVVMISKLQREEFESIKTKLQTGSLALDDIRATQISNLYLAYYNEDADPKWLNKALSSLITIDLNQDGELYVIVDATGSETSFSFYSDYDSMATAIENKYATCVTPWDNMSDDALSAWIERIEEYYDGIPYGFYDDED